MRWTRALRFTAAVFAVALCAQAAPAMADPVLFTGSIFKERGVSSAYSKVYNSRKGKKYRTSGLKTVGVTYDWSTPAGSLGEGATAQFDGKKKNVNFRNSLASMFGKKFAKKKTVILTLFTGSGNELTVGSQEELAAVLTSPTGDLKNAFGVGGTINFSLKVISKKNGKVLQQINDSFVFKPSQGLNVVGKTDDGIAMFLQGSTKSGKFGSCVKRRQDCKWLRRNFYGKEGFKINLALTGSSGTTGGGPILDPLEEIEETNDGTPGGTGGGDTQIAAVPAPGTLGLLIFGAAAMGYLRRRAARA